MQALTFEKNTFGIALLKDLHSHKESLDNCFEIIILEKAKGHVQLKGENIKISNNTVLFAAPSQKKKWNFESKQTKGFRLIFRDSFFSKFFKDPLFAHRLHYFYNAQFSQSLQLSSQDFNFIKSLLSEVATVLKNSQNDRRSHLKALLHTIFLKLNSSFSTAYKLSSETEGNSAIYKFKESLERNFRKFHMVDDYCDILQIQRNKLNRIVKTHFDKTAKETIHFRLLHEIKLELLYSHKTIVQISNDLNFSEPNNMTRFFNRLEGIPPSVFREKYQKDTISN